MTWIASLIFFILSWPFQLAWGGFVFVKLWDWFIGPVFNFHPLSIHEAVGLSFVVSSFTMFLDRIKFEGETPLSKLWNAWLIRNIGLGMLLTSAWLWHWLALFH